MLAHILAGHARRQVAGRHALQHLLGFADRLHDRVEHFVRARDHLRVGAAELLRVATLRQIAVLGRVDHRVDLADDALQRVGGLVDALRQHIVLRAHRHLRRQVAGRQPIRGAGHAADVLQHFAEGTGQRTDFVVAGDVDLLLDATARDFRRRRGQRLHGADDAAQRAHRKQAEREQRHDQHHGRDPTRRILKLAGLRERRRDRRFLRGGVLLQHFRERRILGLRARHTTHEDFHRLGDHAVAGAARGGGVDLEIRADGANRRRIHTRILGERVGQGEEARGDAVGGDHSTRVARSDRVSQGAMVDIELRLKSAAGFKSRRRLQFDALQLRLRTPAKRHRRREGDQEAESGDHREGEDPGPERQSSKHWGIASWLHGGAGSDFVARARLVYGYRIFPDIT